MTPTIEKQRRQSESSDSSNVSVRATPRKPNTSTSDKTFEDAVTRARKNRSQKVMTNRSILHARHVISELLQLGLEEKHEVFIVSGTLNESCYDPLTKYVPKYDAIGLPIVCWVTDISVTEAIGSFAQALKNSKCSSLHQIPFKNGSPPHFIVVGQVAYRLETDHASAQAILSFNDPGLATSLHKLAKNFLELS